MNMNQSCHTCAHQFVCRGFSGVNDVFDQFPFLNIDGNGAPGTWSEIYEAIGRACLQFEQRPDDDSSPIEDE